MELIDSVLKWIKSPFNLDIEVEPTKPAKLQCLDCLKLKPKHKFKVTAKSACKSGRSNYCYKCTEAYSRRRQKDTL